MRRRGARRFQPIEDFETILAAPEVEDPHARSDAERLIERLAPRQRDIVRSISLEGQSIAATARPLVDERGRGPRRAAQSAEIAGRGMAERRAMKTSELIDALAADPTPPGLGLTANLSLSGCGSGST